MCGFTRSIYLFGSRRGCGFRGGLKLFMVEVPLANQIITGAYRCIAPHGFLKQIHVLESSSLLCEIISFQDIFLTSFERKETPLAL
jgi:hypothetical protein